MKRLALGMLVALAAGALLIPAAGSSPSRERTWDVTITNMTPPGSQPLSPPLFVVHSNRADIWGVGEIATHPLAAIAEDANNAPAETAFAQLTGVSDVFTGAGGPIPPGASRTYEVETTGHANRLSVLTMLVNTNDAFTGLDSLRVRETTRMTVAYDAGSEVNNEEIAFIPGPCCGHPFVREPEGQLIGMHEGITGRGDLDPDVYDWPGAAARIEIDDD